MLKKLLQQARAQAASDLHLTVNCQPMLRVDGELFSLAEPITSEVMHQTIKNSLTSQQFQQLETKGEVDFAFEDKELGRFRINVFKANGDYAMSVRLIKEVIPSCDELGLPPVVQKFIEAKQGLFLATGETGCGKSTTLAALVQKLHTMRSAHIITLEEPIEFTYGPGLCMINQREIGGDTASFASGLKSALREDPDIILVGELRDREALEVALQAAETGHLVLSTLHTRDAVTSINRILDMLPDLREQTRTQLADSLIGIVSQKLYKRRDQPGRIAALEVLVNNDAIKNLIREGRTHQLYSYLQTCRNEGMFTMTESIARLKAQKIIV